jgi:hypothetical protein
MTEVRNDPLVAEEEPEAAAPASPARLDRVRAWLARPGVQVALALLLYLAYWAWVSRPMLWNLSSTLWGSIGDQTGFISLYREVVEQQGNVPFLPGTIHDFAGPEGQKYGWVAFMGQLPSTALMTGMTFVFGATVASSLFATIGVVGTAMATFLLARKLLGNALPALVAGLAFGFLPLILIKSSGHMEFAHGWVFVLVLWRWIVLIERPGFAQAWWASAATMLAVAWTPYFALLTFVVAAACAVTLLIRLGRRQIGRGLLLIVVAGILPVAWLASMLILAKLYPDLAITPVRSLEHLVVYSARPLDYLMPAPSTPFVGHDAYLWRLANNHGAGIGETLLYLGVTVLILALVGLVDQLRRPGRRVWVLLILAIGAFAAWFSAPPEVDVLGLRLPTPSRGFFEIQPGFRVYSRFGLVVGMATALLAGFGLAAIVRRFERPAVRGLIVVVVLVIVAADLSFRPSSSKITSFSGYDALAAQPRGLAAEFPMVPADQDLNHATYYQQRHGKPILNGYREGSRQEARALAIGNTLADPRTISALRALDVRYLLVRRDTELVRWPDPGSPPRRDATRLAAGPIVDLYRLKPGEGELGYWYPRVPPGVSPTERGDISWIDGSEIAYNVTSTCDDCAGSFTTTLLSLGGQPRTVEISGGSAPQTVRLAGEPVRVTVPFRLKDGEAEVQLSASPGPVPVREVDPASADPRSLAIGVSPFPKLKIDRTTRER